MNASTLYNECHISEKRIFELGLVFDLCGRYLPRIGDTVVRLNIVNIVVSLASLLYCYLVSGSIASRKE